MRNMKKKVEKKRSRNSAAKGKPYGHVRFSDLRLFTRTATRSLALAEELWFHNISPMTHLLSDREIQPDELTARLRALLADVLLLTSVVWSAMELLELLARSRTHIEQRTERDRLGLNKQVSIPVRQERSSRRATRKHKAIHEICKYVQETESDVVEPAQRLVQRMESRTEKGHAVGTDRDAVFKKLQTMVDHLETHLGTLKLMIEEVL